MTLPLLILIRGVPGSGKSTMAKVFEKIGYKHLEADMWWEEIAFDPKLLGKAHLWCLNQTTKHLGNSQPVVVSNTFTRLWEIEPYITYARNKEIPFQIIEATGNWENIHGVPKERVEMMRARWETIEL